MNSVQVAATVVGVFTGILNVCTAVFCIFKIVQMGVPDNFWTSVWEAVWGSDEEFAVPSSPRSSQHLRSSNVKDPKLVVGYMQYLLAFFGSVFSIFPAIDPSGVHQIYGFGYWYSSVLFLMCLAYAFITYWVFSWIQFLAEFNKYDKTTVGRCRRIGYNVSLLLTFVIDFLTSYYVVSANQYDNDDKQTCMVIDFIFLTYWLCSLAAFSLIITVLTWTTLKMLKESTYSKSNSADMKKIKFRTHFLNALCFLMMVLIFIGYGLKTYELVCDDTTGYDWFFIVTAAVTPFPWLMIVAFNYVLLSNKIDMAEFHKHSRGSDGHNGDKAQSAPAEAKSTADLAAVQSDTVSVIKA